MQFFKKKGVHGVKSAEDLFKYITGFEEIDVNLLEGVHSTYNSLSSRFEIEPDDNRNVIYPFEYCWQKSNEGKPRASGRVRSKSEQTDSDDEKDADPFDEMWELSMKQKSVIDSAADFANEIKLNNMNLTAGQHGKTKDKPASPNSKTKGKKS